MLDRTTLAWLAVGVDALSFVAVVGAVLAKRVPGRWRATVTAIGVINALALAQALTHVLEGNGPSPILEPVLHLALVGAIGSMGLVFRTAVFEPERLLSRAERQLSKGLPETETLPVAVVSLTQDGTIRRVNKRAAELLGAQPSQLIGRDAYDVISFIDGASVRASFLRFVGSAGELDVEHEQVMETSIGHRTVRWRRAAQLDDQGRVIGVVSYGEDVTAQREAEEQLRFGNYLLDSVHDAVTVVDTDGARLYGNRAMWEMLGMTREELEAIAPGEWLTPESRPLIHEHLERAQASGDDLVEVLGVRKDGSLLPLEVRTQLIQYRRRPALMSVLRDISSRREAQDLMQRMTFTDALTGLPNRATLEARLTDVLSRLGRSCEDATVLYIDVDNLKSVNDSLGHEAGDRLIGIVAERLAGSIRDDDTLARVGGDEFVILFPNVGAWSGSDEIAARILARLNEPLKLDGHELRISASIGIVECRSGMSPDQVVCSADRAMYVAKRSGGGRYLRHSAVMDEEFTEGFALKNDLNFALERDEFALVYQPVVGAHDGVPVAVEALLRWNHPDRGLLTPDTFIALAEQNGSIRDIGRWVLATACSAFVGWRVSGLDLGRICVNVSPLQLADPLFVADVLATLHAHGMEPSNLELEITETQAMEHTDQLERVFMRLQSEGVRLALDDFGVGHSSLERLRRLPITTLKIDRSFVADLCNSTQAHPIIDTILVLASNLRLNVIAEGVESSCQADYLRNAGCWELQGYAFARPLTAIALLEKCLPGPIDADECPNMECSRHPAALERG